MNFSRTLNGPHVTAPIEVHARSESVVTTVTIGPLPHALTRVSAAVQGRKPGGVWVDCGGTSASGIGKTFTATTCHAGRVGWQFRAKIDVTFGPVPITFSTITR